MYKSINITIGQNIRQQRILSGLSQKAVGKYLGISFQQMQRYENGKNSLSVEKLVQLATLFGCSISTLCQAETQGLPQTQELPVDILSKSRLFSALNRLPSPDLRAKIAVIVKSIVDIIVIEKEGS